jgi:hypothetical protein
MQAWNDMSIGQRILQCAYMATREHLIQSQLEREAPTKPLHNSRNSADGSAGASPSKSPTVDRGGRQ